MAQTLRTFATSPIKRLLSLLFLAPLTLAAQPTACPLSSHISIASGTFSSQPGVTFRLTHFVATLVPRAKTAPDCFQKDTVLTHGEIFIDNASLTQVFAGKLQATQSKIKDFKVQNDVGKVTLSGHITKLIPIAFTIEGPVTTDGSSLLLDSGKIKADGIPVKELLGLVHEHLSNLLNMNGVGGVAISGNTLSFSPAQIAHLKGHIDSVQTTPEGLILRYSRTAPKKPAAP